MKQAAWRSATLGRLRVSQDARQIAHEIEHSRGTLEQGLWRIPAKLMDAGLEATRRMPAYVCRIVFYALPLAPEELAPGWMKWFCAACVAVILTAIFVIFKSVR